MINIYKKAFACAQQYWWFYLTLAVVLELASTFFAAKTILGAEAILQISFLFFLHRNFLLGEEPASIWSPPQGGKPVGRRGFVWLTIVYTVVIMVLCISAIVNLVPNPFDRPDLILLVAFAFFFFNWIGLSVFGTAFPASAVSDRFGFILTLKRARSTALGLSIRLLLGPGLFGAIVFSAIFGLIGYTDISAGLDPADLQQPFSTMMILYVAVGLTVRLIGLFGSTLAVVILCDAYRRVQPATTA